MKQVGSVSPHLFLHTQKEAIRYCHVSRDRSTVTTVPLQHLPPSRI